MAEIKKDILADNIQRFAVTGLSKERYEEAVPEEFVVDKTTGEFLLNTIESVLISNDELSRFTTAFANAVRIAKEVALCGDIHLVEIDDVKTPAVIPYNVNLLNENIVINEANKRLLFNFDLNEYIVENGIAVELNKECNVSVSVTQGEKTKTMVLPLSLMHHTVIDLTDFGTGDINITEIKFIENAEYVNEAKLILHNIFLTFNK